jgi:ubiquinone/menaquinone biosynthesis C-methylase UbiE
MNVADVFNRMADSYDEIRDLWYAWLFSRLHHIITRYVIRGHNPREVLDVGCGTGFQSFLHAVGGASVVGIDISEDSVKVATRKCSFFRPAYVTRLFQPRYGFVNRYNRLIASLLNDRLSAGEYQPPTFLVADATRLPFPDQAFDHVNCCGSTLSFIENHRLALSEIARVLRPGGTFFLEVESRWNLDVFWSLLDVVIRRRLGYNGSLEEARTTLLAPPTRYVLIDYPFGEADHPIGMRIKLFTNRRLRQELSDFGLKVVKTWAVHSVTNLIPSTFLDMGNPPRRLRAFFTFLAAVEERMAIPVFGCSSVFLSRKIGAHSRTGGASTSRFAGASRRVERTPVISPR